MRALRIAAALVLAAAAGCKFPELPPIEEDSNGDASSDGTPSDGVLGPNVVITAGPADNATTGPRVTFEFAVRDGSPYCRFDSSQLTPCTSPLSVNLSETIHTFYVQAVNSGGGVDSDSRLWNVDCLPPQPTAETFALFRMEEGSGTIITNTHPWTPPPPNSDARFADPPADPVWIAGGRFGKAVRFSAIALNNTDRIYANVLDPPEAMSAGAHSIEMWVNPMPTFPHDLLLFEAYGAPQAGRMDYTLKFVRTGGQGAFHLRVRNDTFEQTIMSPMVDLGAYHYVAMTYQPGTAPLMFVDGTSVRTSQAVAGTVENLTFAALTRFEGDADEVHLTFRPFTEQELLDQWCPP